MAGRAVFLRVGLLIVLGLAGVLWVVFFLSGDRWRKGQAFESYFTESVQGLEIGASVKFRGVTLGRVAAMGLVSAEYGHADTAEMNAHNYRQVFVRYTIDPARVGRMPETESAIRTGLRARLGSQGITGLAYIELDFVDPVQFPAGGVPWEPKAEFLPAMPSTLSQVQDAAQHFLAELNKVDLQRLSNQIIGLIEDVRGELKSGEIHAAITQAVRLLQTLESNVERADLPALMREVRGTASAARDLATTLEITVQQANVPTLAAEARLVIHNAGTVADALAQAVAKLQPILTATTATMRRLGEGTTDVQQSLAPLLRDTQAALANLRELTEALRQYPAGALLGGPPPRTDRVPERSR